MVYKRPTKHQYTIMVGLCEKALQLQESLIVKISGGDKFPDVNMLFSTSWGDSLGEENHHQLSKKTRWITLPGTRYKCLRTNSAFHAL